MCVELGQLDAIAHFGPFYVDVLVVCMPHYQHLLRRVDCLKKVVCLYGQLVRTAVPIVPDEELQASPADADIFQLVGVFQVNSACKQRFGLFEDGISLFFIPFVHDSCPHFFFFVFRFFGQQ